MAYYPDWLGSAIVEDSIPWEEATRVTLQTFLSTYTLHDSYWLGWHVRPNQEAVGVIRWDTWHTDGRVPFSGSIVARWPLLLIRIERCYQLHMNYGVAEENNVILANTIAKAEPTSLALTAREEMLEYALHQPNRQEVLSTYLLDTPLYQTIFASIGLGQIQIIHGGETRILCLSSERDVIPIPGIPS